jgi:hypothetical protein
MTTLASGTQPSDGGTAVLTNVTTVTPKIEIPIVSDLETTGIFVLSETMPALTNVEGFNLLKAIPGIPISSKISWVELVVSGGDQSSAAPITRQILII